MSRQICGKGQGYHFNTFLHTVLCVDTVDSAKAAQEKKKKSGEKKKEKNYLTSKKVHKTHAIIASSHRLHLSAAVLQQFL